MELETQIRCTGADPQQETLITTKFVEVDAAMFQVGDISCIAKDAIFSTRGTLNSIIQRLTVVEQEKTSLATMLQQEHEQLLAAQKTASNYKIAAISVPISIAVLLYIVHRIIKGVR